MSSQGYWFLFQRFFSSGSKKRAPGVVLLLLIIPSFLIASQCRPSMLILLALLIVMLFLTAWGLFLGARRAWIADVILILLLVCAAMFAYAVHTQFPVLDTGLSAQSVHLGVVENNPAAKKGRLVFTVRLIEHSTRCLLPYRIRVYAESLRSAPAYGDIVVLSGSVRVPSCARNPGGFDSRAFLMRKGIHYTMYVSGDDVRSVAHCMLNPLRQLVIFPAQRYCARVIREKLARPYSALLLGLTVGQRGSIPEEIRTVFSDVGIIHILAVSGLHVGILSFFLLMLLRSLRMRFETAIATTCSFIILYALLVDLRAPVIRATMMSIFIMFGLLTQRRILLVNIIACSAVLMLIFRPHDIFDPGFQLSYAATFAIVVFHKHIIDCFPRWMCSQRVVKNFFVLPLAVSLSAQLGTAPIVAFHFFRCSLIAPLSNVIMVPFVFFVIPVGFMMIGGNLFHPVIAKVFAGASWFFLHCIIQLSKFFASIPYGALWVRRPGVGFFVLYYAAMLCFMFTRGRRRIVAICVLSLIALNVIVYVRLWNAFHPRMCVHFLDVGQGDAMVVEFPDREVAVIDGGKRNSFADYGERVLLPFLHSKGIRKLHTVVVSHPDVDHYGGLVSLLDKMEVGCLLVNGEHKMSILYRTLLETAEKKGVPIFSIHRGQVVWIGTTPLYVLHPPYLPYQHNLSSNERSIVLKCGYGATSFLLTGDYTNNFMTIPSRCLASQVLKFPHHGARLADVRGFLNDVKPQISVISVGERNPFGHPDARNLQLLEKMGTRIYRTDLHGAITITLWKNGMRIQEMCE